MSESIINLRIPTEKKNQLKEASEAAQEGLYFSDRRGSVSTIIRKLIDAFLVAYAEFKESGGESRRLRFVEITVLFDAKQAKTADPKCTCSAYKFPHRRGGGACKG